MSEKDPWAAKLPWLVSISVSVGVMLILGWLGIGAAELALCGLAVVVAAAWVMKHGAMKATFASLAKSWLSASQTLMAAGIIGLMTLNIFWANFSLDPKFDLLFARTYGPLFNDVHPLSVLAAVGVAWALIFRKYPMKRAVLIGLAIAPLHDLVWAGGEAVLTGTQWEISIAYAVIEGLWLVLAVRYATKGERRLMLLATGGFVAMFTLGVLMNDLGTVISGKGPTAAFYNIKDNAMEILGWAVGPILWLMPKGGKA